LRWSRRTFLAGGSDLALGQYARRDLVEQRLEQVVLGPGDHRDVDGRILQRLGCG
jgi:hypothetical protein